MDHILGTRQLDESFTCRFKRLQSLLKCVNAAHICFFTIPIHCLLFFARFTGRITLHITESQIKHLQHILLFRNNRLHGRVQFLIRFFERLKSILSPSQLDLPVSNFNYPHFHIKICIMKNSHLDTRCDDTLLFLFNNGILFLLE